MKTTKFNTRAEWLAGRSGKITGTGLKDVVNRGGFTKDMMIEALKKTDIAYKPTMKKDELEFLLTPEMKGELLSQLPKKIGFFEILAQRLGIQPDEAMGYETPMDRGTRLEPWAVAAFEEETGKIVDQSLVIWTRDDNDSISVSPDGVIDANTALEAKCLASARHIEAFVKKFIWKETDFNSVPDEYREQICQYFVVNDELETLYMTFYDPRVVAKEFFYLTIERDDVRTEVDNYRSQEYNLIRELDELTEKIKIQAF